jgi:hypothetical protein
VGLLEAEEEAIVEDARGVEEAALLEEMGVEEA